MNQLNETIERYNNNPVIFHRDQNRKYAIQGFCKWVVEDGRYETLYYCNDNVLRMFIADARARIEYAKWLCEMISDE